MAPANQALVAVTIPQATVQQHAERPASGTSPRITAAVCTRDRPACLRRALQSLMQQQPLPLEIIVVDNAPSDDAVRTLVEQEFATVRYTREPVPGLDAARNRALLAASGEVVAYLDDDAVADAGWVGAIASCFAGDERVGVCTGRVEALTLATPGARLFEANGGFSRGSERIRVGKRIGLRGRPLIAHSIAVGSGCNMAVRRELALQLDGFDEALDIGSELPGGGDLDMIWRVLDAGYNVVYAPEAQAWHEHRTTEAAAVLQIREHNRSLVAFLVKSLRSARGGARLEIAAFLGWRLIKPGFRLIRRGVGRDPLPARALLGLWASCWRGLLSYRRARRVASARRSALPGSD